MGTLAQPWLQHLHPKNPYDGFDPTTLTFDAQGWGSTHPIFEQLIDEIQPELILEVGTWKGASALHMASLLRHRAMTSTIVCIDTWLGGVEHWVTLDDTPPALHTFRQHGYPTLYYQFLANVMHCNLQDYIIPLPNTSHIAARILRHYEVQADLIYIDASHDQQDVYQDLVDYWPLLRIQGVMFGDDWAAEWPGVIAAVNQFADEHAQHLSLDLSGNKWILHKLPTPEQSHIADLNQRLAIVEQFLAEMSAALGAEP